MLKKRDRLTTKEIESLSRPGQGKSVHGALFSLRFSPSVRAKLSVSVSKKVAARAVDRNRLRRRVYAAAEATIGGAKRSGQPAFVLLMPKKECASLPFDRLGAEIGAIFQKAGLFHQ
ncbi:ribonuclease P protein component [Candidatus Parcubacteria bacterium]|nr:ribonuclease P protein component [Candidatus Parcubacteria bacterium]